MCDKHKPAEVEGEPNYEIQDINNGHTRTKGRGIQTCVCETSTTPIAGLQHLRTWFTKELHKVLHAVKAK